MALRLRKMWCLPNPASLVQAQQGGKLPRADPAPQPPCLKRLRHTAQRQKLPASYLSTLEELVPAAIPAASPLPTTPPEHTTDPLPAVMPGLELRGRTTGSVELALPEKQVESVPGPWEAPYPAYLQRWMMSFALYVCLLLLGTLMLAIV